MCRVLLHLVGVVQAHRTSSNLHEPHQHRASILPILAWRRSAKTLVILSRGWELASLSSAGDGVVRVGSRRFAVLEPPRSSAEAPYASSVKVLSV